MDYEPPYDFVDRVADALVEFMGVSGGEAISFAERLSRSLHLELDQRWISYGTSGQQLSQLPTFADAKSAMEMNPQVVRVDREYRFKSRWFNPSRDCCQGCAFCVESI